jgi:amino acid transporter
MRCINCNSLVNKEDKYCFNCGTKLEIIEEVKNTTNPPTNTHVLVLGILSVALFWIPFVSIFLGIISIVISYNYKKTTNNKSIGTLLGIIGIILSFTFYIFFLIFLNVFTFTEENDYDNDNDYTTPTIREEYNNDERASEYL